MVAKLSMTLNLALSMRCLRRGHGQRVCEDCGRAAKGSGRRLDESRVGCALPEEISGATDEWHGKALVWEHGDGRERGRPSR